MNVLVNKSFIDVEMVSGQPPLPAPPDRLSTGGDFNYAFDTWHEAYQAKRNAEKDATSERMLALLNQRDLLSNAREKAPFTERAPLTEQISAVSQEIAAMLGPERKPPTEGASWA